MKIPIKKTVAGMEASRNAIHKQWEKEKQRVAALERQLLIANTALDMADAREQKYIDKLNGLEWIQTIHKCKPAIMAKLPKGWKNPF